MHTIPGKSRTAQNFLLSQRSTVESGGVDYKLTSSQFEILKVETEIQQTRRRSLLIEPNYLMLQVVVDGASLVTNRVTGTTRLNRVNSLSMFRPGEYWIRDGVGKHVSVNLIVPCPNDTITAVQIGSKSSSDIDKVVDLCASETERIIDSLRGSDDYFSLANTYFGLLARTFVDNETFAATSTPAGSVLGRLCDAVNKNLSGPWTSTTAATHCGYSLYHFSRIFKEEYGIGFHRFLEERRVQKSAELLIRGYKSPEVVCQEVGFSNRNKLAAALRECLGLSFVDFKEVQRAA